MVKSITRWTTQVFAIRPHSPYSALHRLFHSWNLQASALPFNTSAGFLILSLSVSVKQRTGVKRRLAATCATATNGIQWCMVGTCEKLRENILSRISSISCNRAAAAAEQEKVITKSAEILTIYNSLAVGWRWRRRAVEGALTKCPYIYYYPLINFKLIRVIGLFFGRGVHYVFFSFSTQAGPTVLLKRRGAKSVSEGPLLIYVSKIRRSIQTIDHHLDVPFAQ